MVDYINSKRKLMMFHKKLIFCLLIPFLTYANNSFADPAFAMYRVPNYVINIDTPLLRDDGSVFIADPLLYNLAAVYIRIPPGAPHDIHGNYLGYFEFDFVRIDGPNAIVRVDLINFFEARDRDRFDQMWVRPVPGTVGPGGWVGLRVELVNPLYTGYYENVPTPILDYNAHVIGWQLAPFDAILTREDAQAACNREPRKPLFPELPDPNSGGGKPFQFGDLTLRGGWMAS